jgi:hypothetical protein
MPVAQRYGQRKVSLDRLPGARLTAAETDLSQGAGVEQARADKFREVSRLGAQIASASSEYGTRIAQEAKQRADETAFLEATNSFTTRLNDWQYNPETGAYNKKGKDAVDLQTDFEDTFTKTASEVSANLKTPEQRIAFQKWLNQQHASTDVAVKRHVSAQIQAYEQGEAKAAVANASAAIAVNYQDTREVGRQLVFGESVIRNQAKKAGAGPEATEAAIDEFRSKAHESVIGRYLAGGDPDKAREYFTQLRDQIKDPEAIERIEKGLHEGTLRVKAQDALGSILSDPALKTLAERRAEARKKYSGELEDRVLQGLEHEENLAQEADRQKRVQVMTQAKNALEATNGRISAIDPMTWSSLTPQEAATLRNYSDMLTEKKAIKTDFATQYNLKILAATAPDQFRRVNLMGYVDKVSSADLDELANLQASIIRGDGKAAEKQLGSILTQKQVVDDTMTQYNLNPNAKPDSADGQSIALVREVLDRTVQFKQTQLKRELTNDEVREELKTILGTNVEVKGALWGSKTKPLSNLTISDVGGRRPILEQALAGAGKNVDDTALVSFDAQVRLKLGNVLDGTAITRIPRDQVRDIAQQLSASGQTATPDNILKWYLRLLAVGAIR